MERRTFRGTPLAVTGSSPSFADPWKATPGTTEAPATPSLEPRRQGDPDAPADGPPAVPDDAGEVRIPVAASSPAARYLLGEEIARGGMGVVYRATDTVLGREVAVKVLQEKHAPDSGTARRFADEARITGQLQHPNIPAVHDLGVLPDGRRQIPVLLVTWAWSYSVFAVALPPRSAAMSMRIGTLSIFNLKTGGWRSRLGPSRAASSRGSISRATASTTASTRS